MTATRLQAVASKRFLFGLFAGLTPLNTAAAPPADAKQTFSSNPAMYLLFEITHTGAREPGTGTPSSG